MVIYKIVVWSHICMLTGGEDRLVTSPADVMLYFKTSAEDETGGMKKVPFKVNVAYTIYMI